MPIRAIRNVRSIVRWHSRRRGCITALQECPTYPAFGAPRDLERGPRLWGTMPLVCSPRCPGRLRQKYADHADPNRFAQQRRIEPILGFGVFQIPPDETEQAVATTLEVGLPPPRHGRLLPERGSGRPGCARQRHPARRAIVALDPPFTRLKANLATKHILRPDSRSLS